MPATKERGRRGWKKKVEKELNDDLRVAGAQVERDVATESRK